MKRERKKSQRRGIFMKILGGNFLTSEDLSKTFPFLVYVTVLLMLIITNAYIAESANRSIKRNEVLIHDLKVEYLDAISVFTQASKQSDMEEKLSKDGIKESMETRTVREN